MKEIIPELFGETTGKPLIALWTHFPDMDLDPNGLVDQVVHFQNKYPNDLLKIPLHGRYCVVDFGCKITKGSTQKGETGSSSCRICVVQSIMDWEKIQYVDPLDGHYGKQLRVLKMLKKKLPNIPMMMTVFSPTMVMRKLSNNQFANHFFQDRKLVEEAFKIIEKVTIEFMNAAVDHGVEGIFMATQEADLSYGLEKERQIKVLSLNEKFAHSSKASFTVLHIHGEEVLFEEAIKIFEPTAVNWHDNKWPSIEEAHKLFKGGLFAGLDPEQVLNGKIEGAIRAKELREKVPLILAPNCVLLQGTKEEYLMRIFENYKDAV